MKRSFILFLSLYLFEISFSQISIERQGISSTGNLMNTGAIIAHSMIGTPVIATFKQTSLIVTQGFEQPVSNSTVLDIFTNIDATNIHETTISVYPNPANAAFTIQYYTIQEQEVTLFNCFGNAVYNDIYFPAQSQKTIDVSHLAKGLYFLKIGEVVGKVVLE